MLNESDVRESIEQVASGVSVWEFQQDPAELASLICYLKSQPHPIRNYLEIGAGSGLVAHTLNRYFQFERLHTIDNNGYDFSGPGRAKRLPQAVGWVGDSTVPECLSAVIAWDVTFDLVIIDGCHNGDAPKSDTLLVMPWVADGGLVAFHDKGWGKGCGGITHGVKEWLAEVAGGAVPGLTEEPWTSWNQALYRYRKPQWTYAI